MEPLESSLNNEEKSSLNNEKKSSLNNEEKICLNKNICNKEDYVITDGSDFVFNIINGNNFFFLIWLMFFFQFGLSFI